MTRSALLPALLLSLSLVAAGCGGDDAEPEEKAEPLSKAEFTAQANTICSDATEQLQADADAIGDAPTQEEIEQFAVDSLVPNLQEQHDDLADLAAPEGDEETVDAILAALQEGIDSVEADPGSITDTDPLAEASELAGEYGLTDCAV